MHVVGGAMLAVALAAAILRCLAPGARDAGPAS
jgi:hypothetical protein